MIFFEALQSFFVTPEIDMTVSFFVRPSDTKHYIFLSFTSVVIQKTTRSAMTPDGLTIRPSKVFDHRVLNGGSNSNEYRTETSFISEKDRLNGVKPKTFKAIYPKQTSFSRGRYQHKQADKFWKRTKAIVVSRQGASRIEYRPDGGTTLKRKEHGKRIVNYPHFVVINKGGKKNC